DVAGLNDHLLVFSYVGGYVPAHGDAKAFAVVAPRAAEVAALPNVGRWLEHMESFTDADRAAWP
ncbi:unnamed protein product, partial [Phaeothamnion confervicola]